MTSNFITSTTDTKQQDESIDENKITAKLNKDRIGQNTYGKTHVGNNEMKQASAKHKLKK